MAFREDTEALHARIESLEKDIEDARGELSELPGIVAERDRLRARVEALEPKRPKPARPPINRGDLRVVLALAAVLVVGVFVYFVISLDQEDSQAGGPLAALGAAENKPPDTRPPSIGVVDLAATPDPVPIPFTVSGTDEAPEGCRGYLPNAPQLVLRATTPTLVRITTRCNVDLVAVLSGPPTGLLCDDDSGGSQQPLLTTTLPVGDARLTIGTYSEGASASCELVLHATPLADGVDAHGLATAATPSLGVLALEGSAGIEQSYVGQIGATIILGSTVQSGCPGNYASVPDLVLDVSEPTIARIDAGAPDTDLVLMMRDPDGTFTCDDDDGLGNAPRIAKRVAAGRYAVWVGTYSEGHPGAAFHVGARLTTVASEAAIVVPTLDVVDGPVLHVTGTTGDELSAGSMWSDCAVPGYVPYEPSTILRIAARRDVTITSGRGDLLLALTAHDQRTTTLRPCTVEPAWRGTLETGAYDLYVGVASGESEAAPFDLTVSAAPPSVLPYTP